QRLIQHAIKKQKVSQLDWLVVSHGDNDHSGGAAAAIKAFKPKKIIAGEPERLAQQVQAKADGLIDSCDRLTSDDSRWEIQVFDVPLKNNSNNHSCVVKITLGTASVLLT